MALKLSRANKTGDEAHPQQALVFAKGKVGSFIGNGWEWPYALDPKLGNPSLANKIGAYPMPSHTPGKYMPTFLGGSNLAIPVTSKQKALAADWIAAFTSTANMTEMATKGGVIPNTTSLARINAAKPTLAPFAEAAKSAGSCRRPRTGPTSRARTCSRACSAASSATPRKTKAAATQAATGSRDPERPLSPARERPARPPSRRAGRKAGSTAAGDRVRRQRHAVPALSRRSR